MNNLERCEKYRLEYWKNFVIGRRGNPWWIIPTLKMKAEFEIYGLSKQNKSTGESEFFEVLFDREYVEGWLKANGKLVATIKSFSVEDIAPKTEDQPSAVKSLEEFEKDAKIIPSGKNPRHSLYLKFKEYTTCQK